MIELSGSLGWLDLPKLLALLVELDSGRLEVFDADSTAEVFLSDGQVVAAWFGTPRNPGLLAGLTALDALLVRMSRARFNFAQITESAVGQIERNIDQAWSEVHSHLLSTAEQSSDLQSVRLPLSALPARVDPHADSGDFLLTPSSLSLLRSVDGRRPVHELIQGRDFLSAVNGLLLLEQQGLIRLDLPTVTPKTLKPGAHPLLRSGPSSA